MDDKVIDLIKINIKKSSRHDDKDHPGREVQSISELHPCFPKVEWRRGSWEGAV